MVRRRIYAYDPRHLSPDPSHDRRDGRAGVPGLELCLRPSRQHHPHSGTTPSKTIYFNSGDRDAEQRLSLRSHLSADRRGWPRVLPAGRRPGTLIIRRCATRQSVLARQSGRDARLLRGVSVRRGRQFSATPASRREICQALADHSDRCCGSATTRTRKRARLEAGEKQQPAEAAPSRRRHDRPLRLRCPRQHASRCRI